MSRKRRQRKKIFPGPWVGLVKSTMETAAWHNMTYGARSLYAAFRGTLSNDCSNNGKTYLSTRDAAKALGTKATRSIVRWYAELEHHGFIRKTGAGFLGSDGRGIAARYRVTEYAHGTHPPTRDFEKWDRTPFVYTPRKKQNPVTQRVTPRDPKGHIRKGSGNGSVCDPKGHIETTPKCDPKGHISRIATPQAKAKGAKAPGRGSSRRAPVQAGDAGSNPAPEAKLPWTTPTIEEIAK
jgi:hypothetical protein